MSFFSSFLSDHFILRSVCPVGIYHRPDLLQRTDGHIAGNGVYALIGYQEISGLYRADALGYMINTLQWQNGRFALTNQMLGVLGTQA